MDIHGHTYSTHPVTYGSNRTFPVACRIFPGREIRQDFNDEIKIISIEEYAGRICVPVEKINSPSRMAEIVICRQAYWFYMRRNNFYFKEIGRMFGKSHATIIWGVRRIENLISINDPYVARYLKSLEII